MAVHSMAKLSAISIYAFSFKVLPKKVYGSECQNLFCKCSPKFYNFQQKQRNICTLGFLFRTCGTKPFKKLLVKLKVPDFPFPELVEGHGKSGTCNQQAAHFDTLSERLVDFTNSF